MRHIVKGPQPAKFQTWCAAVRGTPDEDYARLPAAEKADLLAALVYDQADLCAYTMRRVSVNLSHVEHIKPQAICRLEGNGHDLDYSNLVACYPRDGMSDRYRYGAQAKGDWWSDDPNDFVSPLDSRCEQRFQFAIDGSITARNDHAGAKKTISVLKLDHRSLTEDRKRVIAEFLYGEDLASPLGLQKSRQASRAICARLPGSSLVEFCVAIRDALNLHAAQLEKQNKRRAAARRRSRGK